METPAAGDLWTVTLSALQNGTRLFCIGYNIATGFNPTALSIDATGVVRIPGSLQVGGYAAGVKPFVSCCVSSAGGIPYNCGQLTARPERNDEGRYTVRWDNAHPFGTNYVPILNIDGQIGFAVGFINHSDQNNNSLVVVTKSTQGVFADMGFYLLIT